MATQPPPYRAPAGPGRRGIVTVKGAGPDSIDVDASITFADFRVALTSAAGVAVANSKLKWLDEDGDRVTMESDPELLEAVDDAFRRQNGVMLVTVAGQKLTPSPPLPASAASATVVARAPSPSPSPFSSTLDAALADSMAAAVDRALGEKLVPQTLAAIEAQLIPSLTAAVAAAAARGGEDPAAAAAEIHRLASALRDSRDETDLAHQENAALQAALQVAEEGYYTALQEAKKGYHNETEILEKSTVDLTERVCALEKELISAAADASAERSRLLHEHDVLVLALEARLEEAEAAIVKAHAAAAEVRAGEAKGDVFVTMDIDLPAALNEQIQNGCIALDLTQADGLSAELKAQVANTLAAGPGSHSPAPAPVSVSAASDGEITHPRVICDGSGQNPIVGARYHKLGFDFDLCAAEFEKLTEEEKTAFEVIVQPGDVPIPYGLSQSMYAAPTAATSETETETETKTETETAAAESEAAAVPAPARAPAPAPAPERPRISAAFVEDLTLADGMEVSPGFITKLWKVANNGSTAWPQNTRVYFQRGEMRAMAGATSFYVGAVCPGESTSVGVELIAEGHSATEPQRTRSVWRLQHDQTVPFGDELWCDVSILPTTDADAARVYGMRLLPTVVAKATEAEASEAPEAPEAPEAAPAPEIAAALELRPTLSPPPAGDEVFETSSSCNEFVMVTPEPSDDSSAESPGPTSAGNLLPGGWEAKWTPDGREYYVDHNKQTTSWVHPVTGTTSAAVQVPTPEPVAADVPEPEPEAEYLEAAETDLSVEGFLQSTAFGSPVPAAVSAEQEQDELLAKQLQQEEDQMSNTPAAVGHHQTTPENETEASVMSQLMGMGFCNRERNLAMIKRHKCNVPAIVQCIISESDDGWQGSR